MDIGETFLKLSLSERQKVIEAFNILKNIGSNAVLNGSADKSGMELNDSVNLPNGTPEKSLKQKTLDNWIVKSKTSSSNCGKELAKETNELSKNFESEKDDGQKKLDKSNKLDNASINNKKLVVLLNRQDCHESELKSPDHNKLSSDKKSTIRKNEHVSENFDLLNLTPEEHSPILTRSYNLRGRGVLDEKASSGTSHSMATLAKCENSDKIHKPIHKSVTKQKPKFKTAFGKDISPSSSCIEVNNDQQTNFDEKTSKEITRNFKCQTSPLLIQPDLENKSIDSNKVTVIDETPVIKELDLALIAKGKRKRTCKDKASKKLCTSNVDEKSLNIQESGTTEEINVNIKNTQFVQSKKATKLSNVNKNPSELLIEKTVQFTKTFVDTSPSQEPISTNDIVKSVSKLKLKKTTKSKDRNELVLHEERKLDSTVTKGKKKYLPGQDINSVKQLESTKDSESQVKECSKLENLSEKDTKSVTSVNGESSWERSNENKDMIMTENSLLSDPESTSNNNDKEFVASIDIQNKEFVQETDELFINKNTITPTNSKGMCKKKGSKKQRKVSAKNNLIPDFELASLSNEAVIMTPETSTDFSKKSQSQCKEFVKDTEQFPIKDVNSKKMYRKKTENKSKTSKTDVISNSKLTTKNNDKDDNISAEISTDSSINRLTQMKQFAKETEELLMKENTVTPLNTLNIKSKKTSRKKSDENKIIVATKNNLNSISKPTSKKNGKDNNSSIIETSFKNSSTIKDAFTNQINSSFTKETVTLNQNNCFSFSGPDLSDDHNRKHSKSLDSFSYDEQKNLTEMKELQEDQSKKSKAVSSAVPQINDELHTQEISQQTYSSKKVSTSKKKTLKQSSANSKKKLKVTKDKNQSNTIQSNSGNIDTENSELKFKNSGSKKAITTSKIKLGNDSNKEQPDVRVPKSIANSLHFNTFQEQKKQCLKNLKLNNKLRVQKEEIKVKNSKKCKENHSKKKNNMESQTIFSTNLSKNGEMVKLNCESVEEDSKKNKLCKNTINNGCYFNSESGKENHIRDMEGKTDKVIDYTVDNSNDLNIADTSFKDSCEFDEKMKHNYEAFCKVKEVLAAIGINVEELFENPEMINSLKSVSPDGVYFIKKCKSDSTFSVYMHESKKELRNLLNKMKEEMQ